MANDLQSPPTPTAWLPRMPDQNGLQSALHGPHAPTRELIIRTLLGDERPALKNAAAKMASCCCSAHLTTGPVAGQVAPRLIRCKHRLCPYCGNARSMHVAAQIEALITKFAHPRLMVLTVASATAPLRDQLRRIRLWFARLRRHPSWRSRVLGGVYTLECTRNPDSGLWHPHLNVIYDGEFYPAKVLQAAWHEITGGSKIVWLSDVKDPHSSAWELAKYIGKPQAVNAWPSLAIADYAAAIHGARMCQTFGECHGQAVADEDPEPAPNPDAFSVSLSRLAYLAGQGEDLPAEILYLTASRWPAFGRYVWLLMPQLEPDDLAAARVSRSLDAIRGIRRPASLPKVDPVTAPQIEARLWIAFRRFRHCCEAGLYAKYDMSYQEPDT